MHSGRESEAVFTEKILFEKYFNNFYHLKTREIISSDEILIGVRIQENSQASVIGRTVHPPH